jgi:hypothetical protein
MSGQQLDAMNEDVGPMSYRKSPWELIHRDLVFFASHFWSIRGLFGGADEPASPYMSTLGHLMMVFVSAVITFLCLAVALAGGFLIVALLYIFAIVSHRFQGDHVRQSRGSQTLKYVVPTIDGMRHQELEKWFL